MATAVERFVVVHRDGTTRPYLYRTFLAAQRGAHRDGDAVVQVFIDLEREPLFIKGRRL